MVDWSDDRIAALSKQDLKNLLANAERKSAADIVARCKAEMEKRDTSKPRNPSKPRTEVKELEHAMSEQLAEIGKAMAAKYDLSEETAKAKSAGVKGFKAHKFLLKDQPVEAHEFHVIAPLALLDGGKPIAEIRPTATEAQKQTADSGLAFTDLPSAAAAFEAALAKIAA